MAHEQPFPEMLLDSGAEDKADHHGRQLEIQLAPEPPRYFCSMNLIKSA